MYVRAAFAANGGLRERFSSGSGIVPHFRFQTDYFPMANPTKGPIKLRPSARIFIHSASWAPKQKLTAFFRWVIVAYVIRITQNITPLSV